MIAKLFGLEKFLTKKGGGILGRKRGICGDGESSCRLKEKREGRFD